MLVSELKDEQLDYWVARATGMPVYELGKNWPGNGTVNQERFDHPVITVDFFGKVFIEDGKGGVKWEPSSNWAQGGPIIELEAIGTFKTWDGVWMASMTGSNKFADFKFPSATPLEAAMRCYVAHKLGVEVADV